MGLAAGRRGAFWEEQAVSEAPSPAVSVVLAVYNGGVFLKEALDSIFTQTFTDFELVVVDDASTDGTAAILSEYDDARLMCVRNRENVGQTRSLNRGLRLARGVLIARHDADDVSHPDRLRRQVEAMESRPQLVLLGTAYERIDREGRVLDVVRPPTKNAALQERLEEGNIFCHGSVMMRREPLEAVGGYNNYFSVTQDYDLWLRLAERGMIGNLPDTLYRFRFDGESVSRQKRDLQLAYRRLAWELAQRRRAGQREGPLPDDVLLAYPPEPERLFGDARRSAYLFYAAGQREAAAEMIAEAQEAETISQAAWGEWTWSRARELARLRRNVGEGVKFIAWVFEQLPDEWKQDLVQKTTARFFADQAFQAHQEGQRRDVARYAWQAVAHDWRWLRNKGLWSIAWRSLVEVEQR